MTDIKTALKVKEALITLSDYLDTDPVRISQLVTLGDPAAKTKMVEASKLWNAFEEAPFEDRAKMLGIRLKSQLK